MVELRDNFVTQVPWQDQAEAIAGELLGFLVEAKRSGKKVVGYGAAAKGNTLINFAGVRSHLLQWVVDRNPAKVGKYLPGSRIPVRPPADLAEYRPDDVVILPWNIALEIVEQQADLRRSGARFVTAVPRLRTW